MIRPPFAARVVTGLIVTAIEETRKLPSTAVTLPMTAVSQTLQAGMRFQQGIAELAIKGDEVLDAIFHRAQEEPEWATFDDDEPADVTVDPKAQSATATVTPITAAPTASAPTASTTAPTQDATPGHIPTAPDEPTPADMPAAQAETVEPTPPAPATKTAPTRTAAKKASAAKAPAKKAAPHVDAAAAPPATGRFALYSSAPENVVRSDVEATPVAPSADAPEIVEYLDYDALTLAQLRSKIRSVDLEDLRALADYERTHRGRAPFQTMLDNRITAAAGK